MTIIAKTVKAVLGTYFLAFVAIAIAVNGVASLGRAVFMAEGGTPSSMSASGAPTVELSDIR